MRGRFFATFIPGRVLLGCLLALFLPACSSSYHTTIKGESPSPDKHSTIQLQGPRAPAVIVRAKQSGSFIEKQDADMDKEALDRTIEQLRESGLFSDVWTHSDGGLTPEAVTVTMTLDRQWDQHFGVNALKAIFTGLLLLLPEPFIDYHEDVTGQMNLEATNGRGDSKQYSARGEGTTTAFSQGIVKARLELDDKIRAHVLNAIISQMRGDEKLYALSPGAQVPATMTKRSPAQPRKQKPAAEVTSPDPPPPPIY